MSFEVDAANIMKLSEEMFKAATPEQLKARGSRPVRSAPAGGWEYPFLQYIEDPFEEEDFESFSALLKKNPNSLIVGDDLTVTNLKRLEKAIKIMKEYQNENKE